MFCVYLTTYNGNLMPKFYIGSSSVERIENKKYRGSVRSEKYRDIWKNEIKNNFHLFSIEILARFNTREEAIADELKRQIEVDARNNPLYINGAHANANGCFGTGAENHPFFGLTKETSKAIAKACKSKQGRNKLNNNGIAQQSLSISKTQTGKTQFEDIGYMKRASTCRKLSIDIRKQIYEKRTVNESIKSITEWVQTLGYKVCASTVNNAYLRIKRNKDAEIQPYSLNERSTFRI